MKILIKNKRFAAIEIYFYYFINYKFNKLFKIDVEINLLIFK